jgi:hypothetical protein
VGVSRSGSHALLDLAQDLSQSLQRNLQSHAHIANGLGQNVT